MFAIDPNQTQLHPLTILRSTYCNYGKEVANAIVPRVTDQYSDADPSSLIELVLLMRTIRHPPFIAMSLAVTINS
jgi:hypothetical protein